MHGYLSYTYAGGFLWEISPNELERISALKAFFYQNTQLPYRKLYSYRVANILQLCSVIVLPYTKLNTLNRVHASQSSVFTRTRVHAWKRLKFFKSFLFNK